MEQAVILNGLMNIDYQFENVDWEQFGSDGRSGVEIYRLYDARGVEMNGPAAALLRYSPGAKARRHLHPGYELIYVLQGTLINDTGEHPAGSLEVCPPGSDHELSSEEGCIFLVVWEQPVRVM